MDWTCGLCHVANMSELAGENERAPLLPPLLPRLLAPVGRRWWLMPLGAAALIVVVLFYLARTEQVWTAEMRVYPAPAASGIAARRGLSGLASGLEALSGGGSEAAPPFRYFLDGLATPDVAARLARDETLMHRLFAGEWDERAGQWREPPRGFAGSTRAFLFGIAGLPVTPWTPPDAARLRVYIADSIMVRTSVRSPLVTLNHSFADPAFARSFLEAVVAAADAELREAQAARTAANIDYLSQRLRTTRGEDARIALVEALGEEERGAMLSAVDMPFAAEVFSQAEVGRWPSKPQPIQLVVAGLVVGAMLGAALALLLGWRDRALSDAGSPRRRRQA